MRRIIIPALGGTLLAASALALGGCGGVVSSTENLR